MIEFHKIWIEQCAAARGIKEDLGTDKAPGYLIGEKLMNFVEAGDTRPEFARELPNFVAEVKRIFEPREIRGYLDGVRRVGALGHTCTDEQFEVFLEAGALDEDPVRGAEGILRLARIREMLLV